MFKKYRKSTWALVLWVALVAVWLIGGLSSTHCHNQACNAGKGIGAGLILFVGFCGFVVLSLVWIMSRPRGVQPPSNRQPHASR